MKYSKKSSCIFYKISLSIALALTGISSSSMAQTAYSAMELRGDVIFLDGYIEEILPPSYWRKMPEFSVTFECTGAEYTPVGRTDRSLRFADCTATASPAPLAPFDQALIGRAGRRAFGWRPGYPGSALVAKLANKRFTFTFKCKGLGGDSPCTIRR